MIQTSDLITVYFIAHSPAFLLLIIGLFLRKKKPSTANVLFVIAGIYWLIGTSICGTMLSGIR